MCLAIPGRITKIRGNEAEVDFGGVNRKVRIDLVDVSIGDYVIVHVGYAIQKLDEEEARKSIEMFHEILEIG